MDKDSVLKPNEGVSPIPLEKIKIRLAKGPVLKPNEVVRRFH